MLQRVEFDGYISVNDPTGSVSVPWHVLPHKAAGVTVASSTVPLDAAGAGVLGLSNLGGATAGYVEVFALTGTSPQITNVLSPMGSQDVLIDLKATGVRDYLADDVVQFAVTTYGQRAHPSYPASFEVYVDSNADGTDDYVIFTAENPLGSFATTGQTLVYVQKLSTTTARAYYFATADLNSANMVLTVPASAIGVSGVTQKIKFSVYVADNYFTGNYKDAITGMTHTLGLPKYAIAADSFSMPVGSAGGLAVAKVPGGAAASPSQTGFLLMYDDGKTGRESDAVTLVP